jgi:hypothetical protein
MVEGAEMTGFWGVLLCGLVIGTNISEEPPASVICLVDGGSMVQHLLF